MTELIRVSECFPTYSSIKSMTSSAGTMGLDLEVGPSVHVPILSGLGTDGYVCIHRNRTRSYCWTFC